MAQSVYNEFFAAQHQAEINSALAQAIATGQLRQLEENERYLVWVTAQRAAADDNKSSSEAAVRMIDIWGLIVTHGQVPSGYAFEPTSTKEERLHDASGIRFYFIKLGDKGYAHLAEHFQTKTDIRKLASEMMLSTSRKHEIVQSLGHLSAWVDLKSITKLTQIPRPPKRLCPDADVY